MDDHCRSGPRGHHRLGVLHRAGRGGGLGLGSAGLAKGFVPYRPYLLGITGGLLAGAFALTYRRCPGACGPDGSCRAGNASRRQKLMFWSAVAIAVATYPYWGGGGAPLARAVPSAADAPELLVELTVTGMTCDACVRHVERGLVELPDVQGTTVSHERGAARITLARDVPPEDLIQAGDRVGYKASGRKPGSAAGKSQSEARRKEKSDVGSQIAR
jgi:copper chaperone CopZ